MAIERNLFVAFIVTFERTEFLNITLDEVSTQSINPMKVVLIDNSLTSAIIDFVKTQSLKTIELLHVGKNLGPAGAALLGLKKLTAEGYDWIYWGDDDDPPKDSQTFERLLEIASLNPNAGIIGKVGGKFIPSRARTRVFANAELSNVTEADYVTGGKQMIVSAQVVKAGVLPNPKLFFGFEELEYCLRVKDAGFKVLVDGKGIIEARNQAGNFHKNYRWRSKSLGDNTRINRHYYSVRNMLFILWTRGHYFGYFFFLTKNLIKIPLSLKYGISYFSKFSKLTLVAISHQWQGRFGQYISTK